MSPELGIHAIKSAIFRVNDPVVLLELNDQVAAGRAGTITIGEVIPPETKELLLDRPACQP